LTVLRIGPEPIVGWLREHLPLGRGATILVVYASFFATVLALALVVVPAAIHQAETIIRGLPPFFEETRRWAGTLRPAALATSVKAFIASVADVVKLKPPTAPTQVAEVGAAVAGPRCTLGTLLTLVYFWLVGMRASSATSGLPASGPTGRCARLERDRDRLDCGSVAGSSYGRWVATNLTILGLPGASSWA
jgi:predicted PurR-regulated permease PerM